MAAIVAKIPRQRKTPKPKFRLLSKNPPSNKMQPPARSRELGTLHKKGVFLLHPPIVSLLIASASKLSREDFYHLELDHDACRIIQKRS